MAGREDVEEKREAVKTVLRLLEGEEYEVHLTVMEALLNSWTDTQESQKGQESRIKNTCL